MVVARTPFARTALSRQFKDRSVGKIYLAIVKGIVTRERVTIEQPVGRHPVERKKMSVRSHMPRDATSNVTVIRRFEPSAANGLEIGATLVRVKPETGRMHQIRVHLASIGHPCLGDRVYGGAHPDALSIFDRQALHALALSIAHPRSGAPLKFLAPLPADFLAFLARESGGVDAQIDPGELRRWIELD
jgi:23S rRNA pseudouridine1911/1915/1917 synthase